MVKFLIEQKTLKASTKITQAFGAVVRNGNDETVQTLLEVGVEVDVALDDLDITALVLASDKGHASLVTSWSKSYTPVHCALFSCR